MDSAPYVEGWRRRFAEERRRLEERRERIVENLRRVAPDLAREFSLSRVTLFGSWAWGQPHARSDIDVSVRGLRPENETTAAARIEDLFLGVDPQAEEEIDLKREERLPEGLRDKIRVSGLVLYADA